MTKFIFLLLVLLPSFAHATENPLIEKALALKLSESNEWHRLVHYQKKTFGGIESQVDGLLFFLASDGKTNPESELKATIEGFQKPLALFPKDKDPELKFKPEEVPLLHPLCRFPARAIYLGHALGVNFYDQVKPNCIHFADFKKKLDAISATLVFSSFYLGSPSSTFGHTFLQIRSNRAKGAGGDNVELLDHGINYAAVMTTSNPFLYAIYGLIGAFRGNFTSVPFYFKVREYNDYEARDLWSYDLNLTAPEMEMLVAHIWELGFTYYDYFYFTENCSYHMFTTLEAASTRLHLIDKIPFYVIPSDTVRSLVTEPGLVGEIHYRPSNRAQFETRLSLLNDEERVSLKRIAVNRDLSAFHELSQLPLQERAKILDASMDYMEFANPEDVTHENTESSKYKQELLVERAKLGVKSPELKVLPEDRMRPHVSHGIKRSSFQYGSESHHGQSFRVGMRFALHDTLDPAPGYPSLAEIEFMHLKARYEFNAKSLSLDELTLFRVLALTPFDSFHHKTSYRVQLGYSKFRSEGQCRDDRCYGPELKVAFGLSFALLGSYQHPTLATYFLPEMQNQISSGFRGSQDHFSLGGRAGLLAELGEYSHLKLEIHPAHFFFSPNPFTLDSTLEWRQNSSLQFGYGIQAQSLDTKFKNYDYSAQVFYYF